MALPANIVLLTDFGLRDPFVGILKGVIAGISPESHVIDLTHAIEPGDLLQAAVTLWASRLYFPPGSVFCCVVDPGVGTERQAILLETRQQIFIGPDNGLFTFLIDKDSTMWTIESSDLRLAHVSQTFHGRDIFAPAAAHAALGVPGSSFGKPVQDLVRLVQPCLEMIDQHTVTGEILFADRFGNLLTSLGVFNQEETGSYLFKPWLRGVDIPEEARHFDPGRTRLVIPGGKTLQWVRTYSDLPVGEPAFLVSSNGLIELVANQANAAEILNLKRGDRIMVLQSGD